MKIEHADVIDLYVKLRADNAQRNGEYDSSRQRYHGVLWDAATNPASENRYSLSPNYLKPFVDKSIQLLVGRLPALQVMPPGTNEMARRQAEGEEGVLYGTWDRNNAGDTFFKVAWDSFVLRRGLVYYWWDNKVGGVRFRHCTPDDFYPEWDGDTMYRAIYVTRRLTAALQAEYPESADLIYSNTPMDLAEVWGQDQPRRKADGYTTVIDYYDMEGTWARVAGDYFYRVEDLGYPTTEVPFIEFPCYPVGGNREPMNMIDQLVELNQYLAQVVSQKADIIARYSDPTILDEASGQAPEDIRRSVSNGGSVLPIRKDSNIRFLNWEGTVPAIDEQIQLIMDMLYDLAGKPRSSFGQTVTNQSGVVTNLTLTPTLQSNEYHETLWGAALSKLNERILELTEKFAAGDVIDYKGRVPSGLTLSSTKYLETSITGSDIGGWYKNRVKWPSAIRIDDPVYVQNDLSQLTSDPPAISLYTSLENRGIEDVEAEIDRIQQQLEDPRMHPDRLTAGMDALGMAQPMGSPDAAALAGPGMTDGGEAYTSALSAQGSPYADALS